MDGVILELIIIYLVISATLYEVFNVDRFRNKWVAYLPIINMVYLSRYKYDLFNSYKLRQPLDKGNGIVRNEELRKNRYKYFRRRFSIIYTVIYVIMVIPYLIYNILDKDLGYPDYLFYTFIIINIFLITLGVLKGFKDKITRGEDRGWN